MVHVGELGECVEDYVTGPHRHDDASGKTLTADFVEAALGSRRDRFALDGGNAPRLSALQRLAGTKIKIHQRIVGSQFPVRFLDIEQMRPARLNDRARKGERHRKRHIGIDQIFGECEDRDIAPRKFQPRAFLHDGRPQPFMTIAPDPVGKAKDRNADSGGNFAYANLVGRRHREQSLFGSFA